MATTPLRRSTTDKYLGGVCGGLAATFTMDPNIVRILFVLAAIFLQPIGWIAYVALWLLLPTDDGGPSGLTALMRQFQSPQK